MPKHVFPLWPFSNSVFLGLLKCLLLNLAVLLSFLFDLPMFIKNSPGASHNAGSSGFSQDEVLSEPRSLESTFTLLLEAISFRVNKLSETVYGSSAHAKTPAPIVTNLLTLLHSLFWVRWTMRTLHHGPGQQQQQAICTGCLTPGSQYDLGAVSVMSIMSITWKSFFLVRCYYWHSKNWQSGWLDMVNATLAMLE